MNIRFTDIHARRGHVSTGSKIIIFALAVTLILATIPALAQDVAPMAIPAEFVRELAVPGTMDQFLRPAKIFYDRAAGELYVADQGNNRIVIFNRQGTYRFEFAMAGRVGSIVDFAVVPEGFIYVLGSTRDGRKLLQFDFDGLFLGELLTGPDGMAGMDVMSLAIDADQNIHLLDVSVPQLVKISKDGAIIGRTPILDNLDEKTRREMVFGSLSATPNGLLLPLSSIGTVYQFSVDDEHVGAYGYRGTTTGELNFPVSASVNDEGLVFVLDKQRYCVLCFAPNGKFVGEFGGKGMSPGWFYLPSYLATDESDQVYISQVFLNRVQVCRIPASIQRRFEQAQAGHGPSPLSSINGNTSLENQIASKPNNQPTEGGSQ